MGSVTTYNSANPTAKSKGFAVGLAETFPPVRRTVNTRVGIRHPAVDRGLRKERVKRMGLFDECCS